MTARLPDIDDVLEAFDLSGEAVSAVLKDDEDSLVLLIGTKAVLKRRKRRSETPLLEGRRLAAVAELEATLSESSYDALCPVPLHQTNAAGWVYHGGTDGLWTASRFVANGPVFDWLDQPKLWNDAQSRAAGRLLARLHKSGGQATRAQPQVVAELEGMLGFDLLLSSFEKTAPRHISLLAKLSSPGSNEPIESARQNIALSIEALTQMGALPKEGPEAGFVHGDFHPGNVLFEGDEALCVIDLDYAQRGNSLFDVAYACITFGDERASAFIDGYFAGGPTVEQSLVVQLLRPLAAAWILLWCLDNWQASALAGRLDGAAKQALKILVANATNT